MELQSHEALVIGAGPSGIAAAVALKREGVDDFLILDSGSDFGGTWRDNTYPGVACDTPVALYSFTFFRAREWSRFFAPGHEIRDYLLDVAQRFGLRRHAQFGVEMQGAQWDDDLQRWVVDTNAGRFTSRFIVFATGSLQSKNVPDIPGLDTFKGNVFHSSEWPDGYDGGGERVAVIGTGASAIQFVPHLQRAARRVVVFQRTPGWVIPKLDWKHSRAERWLMRRFPSLQSVLRGASFGLAEMIVFSIWNRSMAHRIVLKALTLAGRLNIRRWVRDPEMRRALTPDFLIGCKRMLVSNEWYRALTQPNVELVAHGAAAFTESSVIAADGSKHEVDTVILSTGFHFTDAPLYRLVRDRDGVSLQERWQGSPRAYKGTTIAGCPNAFVMWGPNAGTGSLFLGSEAQAQYIAAAVREMRARDIAVIEVREDVELEWKAAANRWTSESVMTAGRCQTYYVDRQGHNVAIWPGSMRSMRKQLRAFDAAAYHVVAQAARTEARV